MIRKIIESLARHSSAAEVTVAAGAVTEVAVVEVTAVAVVEVTAVAAVITEVVDGTDPVATVVLIKVLGGVGVVVETAGAGAGMAGAIPGRGTLL